MDELDLIKLISQEDRAIYKFEKEHIQSLPGMPTPEKTREALEQLGFSSELEIKLTGMKSSDFGRIGYNISKPRFNQMLLFLAEEQKLFRLLDEVYQRRPVDTTLFDNLSHNFIPEPEHPEIEGHYVLQIGNHKVVYFPKIGNLSILAEPVILKYNPEEIFSFKVARESINYLDELKSLISSLKPDQVEFIPLLETQNPDMKKPLEHYVSWMQDGLQEHKKAQASFDKNMKHSNAHLGLMSVPEVRRIIAEATRYHLLSYLSSFSDQEAVVVDLGPYDGYFMSHIMRPNNSGKKLNIYGIEANPFAAERCNKFIGQNIVYNDTADNFLDFFEKRSVDFIVASGFFNIGATSYQETVKSIIECQKGLKKGGKMIVAGSYSPTHLNKEDYQNLGFRVEGCTIPPLLYPTGNDLDLLLPMGFYVLTKESELPERFQLPLSKNYLAYRKR